MPMRTTTRAALPPLVVYDDYDYDVICNQPTACESISVHWSCNHVHLLLQGFAPDMRHARPTVTCNMRKMTEDAT